MFAAFCCVQVLLVSHVVEGDCTLPSDILDGGCVVDADIAMIHYKLIGEPATDVTIAVRANTGGCTLPRLESSEAVFKSLFFWWQMLSSYNHICFANYNK